MEPHTTTFATTSSERGLTSRAVLCRTLPFALYMLFVGLQEGVELLQRYGVLHVPHTSLYYVYPLKAAAVAALLLLYMPQYREVTLKDVANWSTSALVVVAGATTCAAWVGLEKALPLGGALQGFNLMLLPEGWIRVLMAVSRVAGAVVVVPLMEELFWRSFLIRYIVAPDFESVPIGHFTWPSFLITTVLFGLEHHQIVAGLAAGAIYNVILYKTRSLAQCVLAHAVTNLTLAGFVLYTGKWYFW